MWWYSIVGSWLAMVVNWIAFTINLPMHVQWNSTKNDEIWCLNHLPPRHDTKLLLLVFNLLLRLFEPNSYQSPNPSPNLSLNHSLWFYITSIKQSKDLGMNVQEREEGSIQCELNPEPPTIPSSRHVGFQWSRHLISMLTFLICSMFMRFVAGTREQLPDSGWTRHFGETQWIGTESFL